MPVITGRSSPGCRRGLIQATASGSGGDRGVDDQALEGMVDVPVVVQVLVVSSGSRRVGVEGQRRIVVQVRVLDAARRNFGAGEVTDVPTKTRFRSRSMLGAVNDPT